MGFRSLIWNKNILLSFFFQLLKQILTGIIQPLIYTILHDRANSTDHLTDLVVVTNDVYHFIEYYRHRFRRSCLLQFVADFTNSLIPIIGWHCLSNHR